MFSNPRRKLIEYHTSQPSQPQVPRILHAEMMCSSKPLTLLYLLFTLLIFFLISRQVERGNEGVKEGGREARKEPWASVCPWSLSFPHLSSLSFTLSSSLYPLLLPRLPFFRFLLSRGDPSNRLVRPCFPSSFRKITKFLFSPQRSLSFLLHFLLSFFNVNHLPRFFPFFSFCLYFIVFSCSFLVIIGVVPFLLFQFFL